MAHDTQPHAGKQRAGSASIEASPSGGMAPSPRRRGSVALSMLDQTTAPRLESVLSSVNPPSEDAAIQVQVHSIDINTAMTAAWSTVHSRLCAHSMGLVWSPRTLQPFCSSVVRCRKLPCVIFSGARHLRSTQRSGGVECRGHRK